jgi:hypothetical protein
MPPRTRSGPAGVEEFAELVARHIIALGQGAQFSLPRMKTRLTTKELSEETGIPEETLRYWRKKGIGPKYIRGESEGDKATILYRRKDYEAWEESRLVDPASA